VTRAAGREAVDREAPALAPRAGGGVWLRADAGSITAFVAAFAVALFALFGLVVDGGRALAARQRAYDEAEQAARAGAGALSVSSLRAGDVQIDDAAAVAAARAFTRAWGHPGTAAVVGGVVEVTIRYRMPTDVLGMIGIGSLPITATGSAMDLAGVTRGGS